MKTNHLATLLEIKDLGENEREKISGKNASMGFSAVAKRKQPKQLREPAWFCTVSEVRNKHGQKKSF
jgi:hypothetical protein